MKPKTLITISASITAFLAIFYSLFFMDKGKYYDLGLYISGPETYVDYSTDIKFLKRYTKNVEVIGDGHIKRE